jgi:chromosome segregation ATPase
MDNQQEQQQQDFVEKINSIEKKLGNNKFQEQIEELKKQITEHENKATIHQETKNSLEKTITQLNDTIHQHLDTITKLQTQIDNNTDKETIHSLEKQLDVQKNEILQLNETIQPLKISIDDITKSKTIAEDELQKLQTHYADFQNNFNKFNETHQESIHKLEEQQNLIKSLEDNSSVKNNEIEKLEEENNFLKNELNDYKSNYTALKQQLEDQFESFKQQFLEEHTVSRNINITPTYNPTHGRRVVQKSTRNMPKKN